MPTPSPARPIEHPAAARVLLDAESRRWFRPFFAQSCTVAEAARSLGEKPNSVLYRVRQWLGLGLLEIVAEETRRGRTVRLYRSVAEAFFVPHRITTSEDLLELQRLLNGPYIERIYQGLMEVAQAHTPDWGVRFDPPQDGPIRITAVPDPSGKAASEPAALAPSLWSIVPELRLEPEDAQSMRQELLEVLAKYRRKNGRKAYIFCAGLVPTRLEANSKSV